MLESGIQQLVVADATVQGLIADRFYPAIVPENATYPCATYRVITDVPDYLLDGSVGIEVVRIQVDTLSGGVSMATYAGAKAAQLAIRHVLDRFSGLLPGGTRVACIFVANALDGFTQDSRAYVAITDYMVHFYPGT